MSARVGMTDIITYVRLHADLGENGDTVNGVSYWSDEQVQSLLDQYRTDVRNVMLEPVFEKILGVPTYVRYYVPDSVGKWLETGDQFSVTDTLGNPAPTYTYDANSRVVIFAANALGKAYFLYTRSYDVRSAIAEAWLMKAGLRVQLINWKAGGQNMNEDQEYQHCMDQYKLWSGFQGVQATRLRKAGYGSMFDTFVPGIGKVEPTNYG